MILRKILLESFYGTDVEEAAVNNKPLIGEPFEIEDPTNRDFENVYELDTELSIGITTKNNLIFIYIIHTSAFNDPDPKIIGEMTLRQYSYAPYPIANLIRIHPDYQGKGYSKTLYEWIINNYGGLISDSTLSKQRGKGSFYTWKSLENDGYDMSVVRWSDVEDKKYWNPKKIKKIDNWVNHEKGGFRLVVSG